MRGRRDGHLEKRLEKESTDLVERHHLGIMQSRPGVDAHFLVPVAVDVEAGRVLGVTE